MPRTFSLYHKEITFKVLHHHFTINYEFKAQKYLPPFFYNLLYNN